MTPRLLSNSNTISRGHRINVLRIVLAIAIAILMGILTLHTLLILLAITSIATGSEPLYLINKSVDGSEIMFTPAPLLFLLSAIPSIYTGAKYYRNGRRGAKALYGVVIVLVIIFVGAIVATVLPCAVVCPMGCGWGNVASCNASVEFGWLYVKTIYTCLCK
ncbi:hypothetical protein Desfe_1307 [Desulfurococcus amylolyticus DSM 16532]|uniref:Uncharacterized protein n=1 Tax=Desulfurococcus amylolyticus DSM 16532 TaxID=768672 RepID=I3XTA1_DESAM|nr:hypothetical protein Desfe_1307 [Desulfurococcus amylolyticus DSM 16532]